MRNHSPLTLATQNYNQICATFSRCMKDPRRRFMFGYTVIHNTMEFWYMNHSDTIMTEAFEWIADVSLSLLALPAS